MNNQERYRRMKEKQQTMFFDEFIDSLQNIYFYPIENSVQIQLIISSIQSLLE